MTSKTPPRLTDEEQLRARSAAIIARRERSELKKSLSHGDLSFFLPCGIPDLLSNV